MSSSIGEQQCSGAPLVNFDFTQFTKDDKIKQNIVKVGSMPGLAAVVDARR